MSIDTDQPPPAGNRRNLPATVDLPESGLYVFESHHASDFRMEMGVWPFAKICWMPVGQGRLDTDAAQIALRKDDMLIVPAGLPHRFVDDPSDPFTLVMVCADPSLFAARPAWKALHEDLTNASGYVRRRHARNGFHLASIRTHFRLMVREQSQRKPGWVVQLEGHFAGLLVAMRRGTRSGETPGESTDAVMEGLLEYLDAHFAEAHSLGDLAARCDLSPRRFTERFRTATGFTLTEYLNRKRIAFACERLRETGHVAYACYEAGFQDMAYFYRTFKRYTGATPGAFFKKLKS